MERNVSQSEHLTRLAVKMKKGDRTAAAALYDELMPKTYGFFFTRTGGRREIAEDLAQDMFVRIVERIESFDERKGSFVVWFWQIARNILIDHYREKGEIPFGSFEEDVVASFAIAETPDLEVKFRHEALTRFVRMLETDEQELFELRFIAEMPYKEIATLLGRSEGSLRIAALRVKEKIKKALRHRSA